MVMKGNPLKFITLLRLSSSPFPTFFISSLPQTLIRSFATSNTRTAPQDYVDDEDEESRTVSPPAGPVDVTQLFRRCGCSDADISKIILRQPSLTRSNLNLLQSKLEILQGLGLVSSDLIKIITCRPRFLSGRLGRDLPRRLQFLDSFFGSRHMLLKAVVRNPSLLNYDVDTRMKPCIALYEEMGIRRDELALMLMSRPMIMPRSSLDQEKLEYIRRTGLTKEHNMYKYVVSLIAVSRLETIREKISNFEKFGFSVEDVMGLFGRSPNLLTLSVHKVQRNMTYIIGTMKLPARIVFDCPFLLYSNLETVLKPRFLLAKKIQAMGLEPQIKGSSMMTAMRMKEPRFLKAFINCHTKRAAEDLMEFYTKAKSEKRLAQDSKLGRCKGFPF